MMCSTLTQTETDKGRNRDKQRRAQRQKEEGTETERSGQRENVVLADARTTPAHPPGVHPPPCGRLGSHLAPVRPQGAPQVCPCL